MMTKTRTALTAAIIAGLTGTAAHAAVFNWTGAVSTDWSTAGNWTYVSGTDTDGNGFPNSDGDGDVAVFLGDAATTPNPTLTASIKVRRVKFDTAGWTIGGSGFNLTGGGTSTSDYGLITPTSGVITIQSGWRASNSTTYWNVQGTSVLNVTGSFNVSRNVNKNGTGLIVASGGGAASGDSRSLTIDAGKFLLNSSLLTTNNNAGWTVNSAGTLGGTGQLNLGGTATLSVTGTLAPGGDGTYGTAIESLGVSVSTGTVNLGNGSTLAIEIGTGVNDVLEITRSGASGGYLNLTPTGTQTLSLTGPATPVEDTYTFATFVSTTGYGTFDVVKYNGTTYANPAAMDFGGGTIGSIVYRDTGIDFVVVPEPTTLAGLALGSLLLMRRRRFGI